jgi:signal transduction histidine kinase/CheY-like chemotaxis protein
VKELKREITKKYVLALSIIALLNCFSFLLLHYSQSSTEAFSTLINKSGRQRMLSQRISLIIVQLSNETNQKNREKLIKEASKSLELFEKSHNILTQKNKEIEYELPPALKEHYFGNLKVDLKNRQFISKVKSYLEGGSNINDLDDISTFISRNKSQLLSELNSTVSILEQTSQNKVSLIKKIQLAVFVVSMALLIVILFTVFKPMERQIMARQDELNRAKKKADEENRYKSLFLANMSHELRTPLNGVLGVADLLASTQLNEEQRDYLQVIDQSGNSLLAIINDILDVTKIEMNGLVLENRAFNTTDFCSSLEMIFHYQFLGKHVNLDFITNNLPLVLKGDEHRLKQVLTNLLSNALKFTEKGSVTLELNYDEPNKNLNFSVTDTGVGIDSSRLEGIFDPFKQEDNSTTRVYGRTGLGLTITRELVTAMGGEIHISSSKGKGSKFHGFVKLEKGASEELKKSQPLSENLKNAQILIVDDNEINLKLLSRLLEKSNLSVVAAKSGLEAIEIVKKTKFQLILMDYHMPKMNGTEAAKEIIRLLGDDSPDIICLTADLSEQASRNAREAGIVEVVEKPIRKNKLIEILNKYIS